MSNKFWRLYLISAIINVLYILFSLRDHGGAIMTNQMVDSICFAAVVICLIYCYYKNGQI